MTHGMARIRLGKLERVLVALTLLQKTESVKGWKKPSLRIRSLSLKKQNAIIVTNWFLPAKKSRTPSNQEKKAICMNYSLVVSTLTATTSVVPARGGSKVISFSFAGLYGWLPLPSV